MLSIKMSPILDVIGHTLDSLVPGRVDVYIPCECMGEIKEQLIPLIFDTCKYEMGLFGDISLSDMTMAYWTSQIQQTAAFQSFVEDLHHKFREVSVYAETDKDLNIAIPVKNPFLILTNREKIAAAIYNELRNSGPGMSEVTGKVKSLILLKLTRNKDELISKLSPALSDLVRDVIENTGLTFNEVIGSIKEVAPNDKG